MNEERANDYQVGGTHYHDFDYQIWDFIADTNMPYLLGCIVKYVARHRYKNGIEDINKAHHYFKKYQEKGAHWQNREPWAVALFQQFMKPLSDLEAECVAGLLSGSGLRTEDVLDKLAADMLEKGEK